MSGTHSPSKRRLRRRSVTAWQPSFSVGGILLVLVITISLALLRREIEVLTDLNDDPDNSDWPITHLQLRAADSYPLEEVEEKGPAAWEQALEEHRRNLGGKASPGTTRQRTLPPPPQPPSPLPKAPPAEEDSSPFIDDPDATDESKPANSQPKNGESERRRGVEASTTNSVTVEAGSAVEGDDVQWPGDAKKLAEVPRQIDSEQVQGMRLDGVDGKVGPEADELLARDVTVVICAKHRFSTVEAQLEEVLGSTPPVPVLYVMSGPMSWRTRRYLLDKRRQWPHLELRDAGQYASGYSMRNATLELLHSKYALFLFNDVFPASKHWLHELYFFAEDHPEGVAFAPYTWENRSAGPAAAAAWFGQRAGGLTGSPAEPKPLLQRHVGFSSELTFDDYGNDGKLYVDRAEDEQLAKVPDPAAWSPREIPAFVEDHCLLVRLDFLREALLWDARAGFTRQDVELALTLRYWNRRAFLVPQAQVVYQHPSLGLAPSDLPFFASQSAEETCGANLVYLRQKWGIVTGQLCRGFVDGALRSVAWGEAALPGDDAGAQAQLVLAMFALMGLNRFQMHFLPTWRRPRRRAPPARCRSRDRYSCPRAVPWMAAASDAAGMLEALPRLEGALRELQRQALAGQVAVNESLGGPQLWLGRAEAQMPLRLNRVADTWKASALQTGQLFPVRRGNVKRGDKHPGRKAPELPTINRLYLPFAVVEVELMLPQSLLWRGLERPDGLVHRAMEGMSLVLRERCLPPQGEVQVAGPQRGSLLTPGGRNCTRGEQHYRAWMYVRHLDTEPTPSHAFAGLRRALLRGAVPGAGGWTEARSVREGLAEPLRVAVRRLRLVACVPGSNETCSLAWPVGHVPGAWQLVQWAWRPQSVRTARVLLMGAGADRQTSDR